MRITSSAFRDGQPIPARYTCDGDDAIPPLAFEDVPAEAASLVLIMDDPDAPGGTWDHWLIWNIAPQVRRIEEGKPPAGMFGKNSWGKTSWGGPCPPDREHRYFFKLYALDRMLHLREGSRKSELEKAMKEHVVAEAQLMGRYDRQR